MALTSARRYYLRQRLAYTQSNELELAAVFRAKQEAIAWPDLPSDFPSRSQLMAAGYTTVRDLDGADDRELQGWPLYLSTAAARRVLAAMESWTMILTQLKSYTRQDGRNAAVYNAPLLPSAEKTASGTGEIYEMGDMTTLRLKLDVTAASGTTPTLDVIVETSPDGATEWQTVATFAQKTGVSYERNVFPGCDRFVRAKYTIGGTNPDFTFSLLGEAC